MQKFQEILHENKHVFIQFSILKFLNISANSCLATTCITGREIKTFEQSVHQSEKGRTILFPLSTLELD